MITDKALFTFDNPEREMMLVELAPGQTVESGGVTIAGPLNLASMGAQHASEMYARNVYNFVSLLLKDGALAFDWDDELLAKTVWPERSQPAG